MNTNRSTNYLKSIPNNKSALSEIRKVQADARIFNLEHKLAQAKDPAHERLVKRVDYFGRLGKNNPARSIYQERALHDRSLHHCRFAGAGAYQRIEIKHAATIDIYVRTIKHV